MTAPDQAHPRRNAVLAFLNSTYAVFRDTQPLALGIHKTIKVRHPDIDAGQLRLAMKQHTASTRYLKALSQAEQRLDLDGNPLGEVTQEQRDVATATLKERFKKAAERKRADEQAKQHQEKLLKLAEKFNTR